MRNCLICAVLVGAFVGSIRANESQGGGKRTPATDPTAEVDGGSVLSSHGLLQLTKKAATADTLDLPFRPELTEDAEVASQPSQTPQSRLFIQKFAGGLFEFERNLAEMKWEEYRRALQGAKKLTIALGRRKGEEKGSGTFSY